MSFFALQAVLTFLWFLSFVNKLYKKSLSTFIIINVIFAAVIAVRINEALAHFILIIGMIFIYHRAAFKRENERLFTWRH
ncbi:MAG TPA: hypothetical protein CFH81_00485 [Sulfurovum sp. UBA12169]|nr:MAG TPA: hypothetical protein CFH81_00485 [Sulfurovum sp. UBA12169]